QEEDSEIMDEVIHKIDKGEWRGFSSKWSFLEIARALKKDEKPKEIITVDLEDLRSHKINFLSLSDDLIPKAEELVKESNQYAADAFHIASFKSIKKADAFLCDDKHFNRLRGVVPVKRLSEVKL
ncbi:MAG: type II toxin-antitoxin system VapC family toxin, partial [Candidatus Hydrothermarchaeaceae archaeon]